jgi:hypothetical protein
LGNAFLHTADRGSNTVVAHTSAIVDGKLSGYAWELQESNKQQPTVFVSVHNNGGTKRHAVWGYIHYGDKNEAANRELLDVLSKPSVLLRTWRTAVCFSIVLRAVTIIAAPLLVPWLL